MQVNQSESVPTPRSDSRVDKKEKFGWQTLDKPGVLFSLKKDELHINPTYQRTMVSEARVNAIRQIWSWAACGVIVVSYRNGAMWVLDGQHRVIAAMSRSDLSELPCLVFDELTVEDEARIFYTANNIRGSASPFDRLRALVIARDRLSIDVVEMMEAENYHPHATGGGNNTVCCIAAFVNAVKNSRDAVEQAWPLIAELHGGLVIKKNVFASLVYIARFGTDDIASPNWKKRVLKHGLHEIEAAIARARVLYQKGGSKVYAQATLEVLNKGVMQANKLGLRETDAQDDE